MTFDMFYFISSSKWIAGTLIRDGSDLDGTFVIDKLKGSLMLCVQDGSDLLGMPESQGAQVQWLDRPLWLRGIREETD